MARLILEWLNEEVKLSELVTDLDEDFRDGYLLGELLHRYKQQDEFLQFQRKDTPDAKIKNFCLLEPTLRRIGVTFNFKLASEIMNAKHGTTKALLAEMRAILDRIHKNAQPPIAPVGQRGVIMRVMAPGRDVYDLSMSASFEKSVRMMMENPTDVLIHKAVTNRFLIKEAQLREEMNLTYSNDMGELNTEKARQREIFRHRKKHEGEFAKAWDLINVEQWKKNQTISRERRDLASRVETAALTRRETARTNAMTNARETTFSSIDQFEKRMEKEMFREDTELAATLGASLKKTVVGATGTGVPELTYVDQKYLENGLFLAQKTMKEHHEEVIVRQQAHDRRRRKFVREHETSHTMSLQDLAEAEIVQQLLNQSQTEMVEDRAMERVLALKHVMMENRQYRVELVASMDEVEAQRSLAWAQQEASREKSWVVASRISSQLERAQTLQTAKASAERQRSIEVVSEVLDRILDLTDWLLSVRQLGIYHIYADPTAVAPAAGGEAAAEEVAVVVEPKLISEPYWTDAVAMFISSNEMAGALPFPEPTNVSSVLPYSLCEQPMCVDLDSLLKTTFSSHVAMTPASLLLKEAPVTEAAVLEGEASSSSSAKAEESIEPTVGSDEVVEAASEGEAAPADPLADTIPPPNPNSLAPLVTYPLDTTEMDPVRTISEYLATVDCEEYVSAVANAVISGHEIAPDVPPPVAAAGEEDVSTILSTPSWLLTTPSRHLLGEVIVATRCVAEPLPDDPTPPFVLPRLSLRVAICGVSERARQSAGAALVSSMPGIKLIRAEELVHASMIASQDALSLENSSRDEKQKAAVLVASYLQSGRPIPDSLYVTLLVQAIIEIDDGGVGFVIEDFPNTKEQCRLLIQSLSGIDYSSSKPRPFDRASRFALPCPSDVMSYESSKCGLDRIIFLESTSSSLSSPLAEVVPLLVDERIRERKDLQTGEIVALNEDVNSIEALQELHAPLRPVHTASIEISQATAQAEALKAFVNKLGLLRSVPLPEYSSLSQATEALALEMSAPFASPSPAVVEVEEVTPVEAAAKVAAEATEGTNDAAIADEGADTSLQVDAPPQEVEAESEAEVVAPPKPIIREVALPKRLADSLVEMWAQAEMQLTDATRSYFGSLRDVRYQILQRRRATHDSTSRLLVRRDNRQDLFEAFRVDFNQMEADFRFDADFIAEMHLRALELGDAFWVMCDTRKKEAEDFLEQVASDSFVLVASHRCRCEAAALMQAELNRFTVAVHLLFDYSKALSGFDSKTKVCNPLEETLPLAAPGSAPPPAAGGKDAKAAGKDPKGGKGAPATSAVAVPFRDPINAIILPLELMSTLPTKAAVVEEVVDPKAKGKAPPAKGGKGDAAVEVAKTPLEAAAAAVQEAVAVWSKGTFVASRAVYTDESLAVAIENAIWHEAERLKFCVETIKASAEKQDLWLNEAESSLMATIKTIIRKRHAREIVCAERLVAMIGEAIESAEPIREEWVVSQDSIVVKQGKLILQYPEPPPLPSVNEFFSDKLNEEQMVLLSNCFAAIKTGSVVLEQDVETLLTICSSPVGPLGTLAVGTSSVSNVSFPVSWRTEEQLTALRAALVPHAKLQGIDEQYGVVALDNVLKHLFDKKVEDTKESEVTWGGTV